MNRGKNTVEHWEAKHDRDYIGKKYTYEELSFSKLSYHKVAIDLMVENELAFQRKTVIELGCAEGKFLSILSKKLPKEWNYEGWDFGEQVIEWASKQYPHIKFAVRDILKCGLEDEYGCACMFETIEHLAEGNNYKVLDDLIEHCEYVLISTPSTKDDCFGEHISHYNLDTFDDKGYNVVWKSNLNKIDMSATGDCDDYYYMLFLIKGKLAT